MKFKLNQYVKTNEEYKKTFDADVAVIPGFKTFSGKIIAFDYTDKIVFVRLDDGSVESAHECFLELVNFIKY